MSDLFDEWGVGGRDDDELEELDFDHDGSYADELDDEGEDSEDDREGEDDDDPDFEDDDETDDLEEELDDENLDEDEEDGFGTDDLDDDAFDDEDEEDDFGTDDLDDEAFDDEDFEDDAFEDALDFDADDLGSELADAVAASCPYCGAEVELMVDPGGGESQEYVEDCEVCCQPLSVRLTLDSEGVASVEVGTLDEG